MARAAKPDDVDELVLTGDEKEKPDTEAAVFAEFNQAPDDTTWKIVVTKFVGKHQDEPECFRCTPDDFPIIDRLRKDWGEGKYRVRIWKNNALIRALQYSIIEPPRPATQPMNDALTSLQGSIREAMTTQTTMIERLFDRLGKEPQGAKGPTLAEVTQTLVSLKALTAEPRAAVAAPTEMFSSMIEIFRMGMEASGGSDRSSTGGRSFIDLLDSVIKSPMWEKIGDAITNGPAHQPPPQLGVQPGPRVEPLKPGEVETPMGRIRNPVQATAANGQPATTADQQAQAQVQAFLAQQIGYLVTRAQMWKDSKMQRGHPDLYGDWVIDNIPPELLLPLVQSPDAIGLLQQFVPEVGPHVDWFMALLEGVREELTQGGLLPDGDALANGSGTGGNVPGQTAAGASTGPGRSVRGT